MRKERSKRFPIEEEKREEIENLSQMLLSGITDLQFSLANKLLEDPDRYEVGMNDAIKATNTLIDFTDSDPSLDEVWKRAVRDNDYHKIVAGQHTGYTLDFRSAGGDIVRVNVYGGLRTVASRDFMDTTTHGTTHTGRTRKIVDQSTEINWQYIPSTLNEEGRNIEAWIEYKPGSKPVFGQTVMIVDTRRFEIDPKYEEDDYGFEDIHRRVMTPIHKLSQLIPSEEI